MYKYILRNRNLRAWLAGSTQLSASGCDIAAGILSAIATGFRIFS